MYYVMDCSLIVSDTDGEELIELHNSYKLAGIRRWWSGSPIALSKKENIPNPVKFSFDPLRGYLGAPPEMEDLGIPLMSKKLFDALSRVGVDNIEYFPAKLINSVSQDTYEYGVYNILGKVSATDLVNSEYSTFRGEEPSANASFNKLVLDKSKTKDLLLFRLAEDVSAIIVHESVKNEIENSDIVGISFIKPEDYVQI